jgi:hypothetical protein
MWECTREEFWVERERERERKDQLNEDEDEENSIILFD